MYTIKLLTNLNLAAAALFLAKINIGKHRALLNNAIAKWLVANCILSKVVGVNVANVVKDAVISEEPFSVLIELARHHPLKKEMLIFAGYSFQGKYDLC